MLRTRHAATTRPTHPVAEAAAIAASTRPALECFLSGHAHLFASQLAAFMQARCSLAAWDSSLRDAISTATADAAANTDPPPSKAAASNPVHPPEAESPVVIIDGAQRPASGAAADAGAGAHRSASSGECNIIQYITLCYIILYIIIPYRPESV